MTQVPAAVVDASPADSDSLIDRLSAVPVAVLSDAAGALGLPDGVLKGVRRLSGQRVVGYARTIGRELAASNSTQADFDPRLGMGTQMVIDSCAPNQVIVIGVRGDADFAVWGDNMATRARAVGVRGMVTDGAVRDIDEMDGLDMAVFAAATTPRQAFRRLVTTSINEPVVVGGVRVRPGDLIVADGDGVIAIAAEKVEEVLARAEAVHSVENEMQDYLRAGNSLVSAVEKYKAR